MNISKGLNVILLLGVIILGTMLYFNSCSKSTDKEKEYIHLINSLSDTIRHFKNKDSNNVASISVLQTTSDKAFTELLIADETIKALQNTVREYEGKLRPGSSVTRANIETTIDTAGKTNIVKADTIRIGDTVFVHPTYSHEINNKWIDYKATMNKDSSTLHLVLQNEFSAIVGYTKGRRTQVPYVDLITENPYSKTKTLRTYQVSIPKPKKFGIGPNISYGVGNNFKPQVFIGIGVQYNLLRL